MVQKKLKKFYFFRNFDNLKQTELEPKTKDDECRPHVSFSCGDGQCIPRTYQCDGDIDCWSSELGLSIKSIK
jgi:hypothetical protein